MASVEIKADNRVVREAVMDGAVKELDRLLRNGVLLDEIYRVLQDVCFIPKKLFVIENNGYWMVYHRDLDIGLDKGKLFSNPSMTAAIEFALKYQEVQIKEGEMSGIAQAELEELANEQDDQ